MGLQTWTGYDLERRGGSEAISTDCFRPRPGGELAIFRGIATVVLDAVGALQAAVFSSGAWHCDGVRWHGTEPIRSRAPL
ncbi:hypothetical protein RA20_09035 [Leisingera sp. ANG-Vp]|nr:hypothetical protein RA20_09035 [Leisingera sp. ANG-Vp]